MLLAKENYEITFLTGGNYCEKTITDSLIMIFIVSTQRPTIAFADTYNIWVGGV